MVRALALSLLRAWVPSQVGELKHLTSCVAWSKKKKYPKSITSRHYGMLSPPWKAHRGITPSVCVTQVWGKCYDFCVAFQESVGEEHLSGCLERWGGL